MSLIATTSNVLLFARMRKTRRPMRPNPLIATFTAMARPPRGTETLPEERSPETVSLPPPRVRSPAMDMASALERDVATAALSDGLLLPGDAVLVAVSGGGDSAATAALLAAGARHGLP